MISVCPFPCRGGSSGPWARVRPIAGMARKSVFIQQVPTVLGFILYMSSLLAFQKSKSKKKKKIHCVHKLPNLSLW